MWPIAARTGRYLGYRSIARAFKLVLWHAAEVVEALEPLDVLARAVAFLGSAPALLLSIAWLWDRALLCSVVLAGIWLRRSSGCGGVGVGVGGGFAGHCSSYFMRKGSRISHHGTSGSSGGRCYPHCRVIFSKVTGRIQIQGASWRMPTRPNSGPCVSVSPSSRPGARVPESCVYICHNQLRKIQYLMLEHDEAQKASVN